MRTDNVITVLTTETYNRGPLHKTFTGEKTRVKSENACKELNTIDFTIGRKLWFK